MATYSFLSVVAALDGPGGNIQLGNGAGVSEEGITVERVEDMNTMTVGADGTPMHSLHAGDAGTVRVRLLKTSPTNALLNNMLNFQRIAPGRHGRNTISVRDMAQGDVVTCRDVAFSGFPAMTWSKAGTMYEWSFHAGHVTPNLGAGEPIQTNVV
jgi:hypothetical protein